MEKIKFTFSALLLFIFLGLAGTTNRVYAHCEIPCGIYGDSTRVVLLAEHIQTIEKSMKQIQELSVQGEKNYNQLVRWIMNKEEHAQKIQDIATQYFMFQRIKLSDDPEQMAKNQKLLGLLHKLCVYAMKSKQTTDLQYIEKLNQTLKEFSDLYFGMETHHHH